MLELHFRHCNVWITERQPGMSNYKIGFSSSGPKYKTLKGTPDACLTAAMRNTSCTFCLTRGIFAEDCTKVWDQVKTNHYLFSQTRKTTPTVFSFMSLYFSVCIYYWNERKKTSGCYFSKFWDLLHDNHVMQVIILRHS